MPRSAPSEALRSLVEAAREAGAESLSARQVESWQQSGLTYPPEIVHKGRGSTKVTYPPETSEQLVAVARVLNKDRDYDRAALRLFGQARYVREDRLRGAYESVLSSALERCRELLTVFASERAHSPEIDQRTRSASRVRAVQSWRRRLKKDPTGLLLRSVFTEILMILVEGDIQDEDNLGLIGRAMGVEPITSALSKHEREIAIGEASLARLLATVRSVSKEHLEWARDCLRVLVEYGELLEAVMERTGRIESLPDMSQEMWKANLATFEHLTLLDPDDGLGLALHVPLLVATMKPPRDRALDETIRSLETGIPHLRAVLHLCDDLERKYWPCLGPNSASAYASINTRERDRLAARIQSWCESHPDDAIALHAWAGGNQ